MGQGYVGEIRLFAGRQPPAGWAFCNGAILQVSQYEELFTLIGNIYGGNGGAGTFALPDLRGRLPMGVGAKAAPGLSLRNTLGQQLGEAMVMLNAATMPAHSHAFSASTAPATAPSPAASAGNMALASASNGYWSYVGAGNNSAATITMAPDSLTSGGSAPHPNLMPAQALNFIIALTAGTFPEANNPQVSSLSPRSGSVVGGSGPAGQVTLTGMHFSSGMQVFFGGVAATVVGTPGSNSATVVYPPGTGRVPVTVLAAGGTSLPTTGAIFVYSPSIFSLEPAHGKHSGNTGVVITGYGFTGASAVSFGGTPAVSFEVASDTRILAVAPPAPPGVGVCAVTVTVDGVTSVPDSHATFCYTPDVMTLSPSTGAPAGGDTVTISGVGFSASSLVYFGATQASATLVSATQITAVSPPGSGTVAVSVRDDWQVVGRTQPFSYAPVVSGIDPAVGQDGWAATISGSNFTAAPTVSFGGVLAFVTNTTDNTIDVTVPSGTGTVEVVVTSAGGSASTQFDYSPAVMLITPTGGPILGGNAVIVTGSNFTPEATVWFGTTQAKITNYTPGAITVIAPPGTAEQAVPVAVITAGGTSAPAASAVYTYALSVGYTIPRAGSATGGTAVHVFGNGFVNGQTSVTFGDTAATDVVVNSGVDLWCTAPAGTGLVNVSVTVGGVTSPASAGNQFSYFPKILTINPVEGSAGTPVTIAGEGFAKGATTVLFGDVPATDVSVYNSDTIMCTAPAGGGEVHVTVTTPGGISPTSRWLTFSYNPGVTSISPSWGNVSGYALLRIYGLGFTGATQVLLGDAPATQVTVVSDTEMWCVTPPGHGQVHVTVVTPAGTTSPTSADLYQYGAEIFALSPPGQSTNQTQTVTATGVDFAEAVAVWVGDLSVDFTAISDTQLTFQTPPGLFGSQRVMVVGRHGTSPDVPAAYYNFPPAITAITSAYGTEITTGMIIAINGPGIATWPLATKLIVTFTPASGPAMATAPLWTSSQLDESMLKVRVPDGLSGTVGVTVGSSSWGTSAPFTITIS